MVETERTAEEAKREEIHRIAYDLYCHTQDWASFFREVLGLKGLIRRNYPTAAARAEFERSDTYQQIQQMLKSLREQRVDGRATLEPTRVITVRLPESLHEFLRAEAHQHQTSMNKLCISKLMQFIDEQLVPTELPSRGGERVDL